VAPAAWRVDFADDFSGSSVDERLWLFEQSGYTPTGQRTCSAADSSALQVSAGALRMGVRENPDRAGQVCRYARPRGRVGEHPYMFNTQINTRGKYTFKYGFAAARMKLQRARGMHSAFWLLPENWELPPGNPAGGTEVDIVEWFGHDPAPNGLGINAFIHYRDAAGGRVKIGDPREEGYRDHVALLHDEGEEWWNAYHVFSLEWTPEAYVFRVDGREFYRETRAITHTPAYISLSMLLGDYELKHLTPEGRSDAAMVDWVRVYQPQ
jgi:beta-glucanase (GH16 family)